MSACERLRGFKRRIKEKARRAFGSESSSGKSTDLLTDVRGIPPSIDPAPQSSCAPATHNSALELVLGRQSGGRTGFDQTWICLKEFLQVLDKCSGVLGPLRLAMNDFVQFIRMHEDAVVARRDCEALKTQLEMLFSDLGTYFSSNVPPAMTASIDNLCTAIKTELGRISGPGGIRTGRRHLETKNLEDVIECYRRIHGHLERLTFNADLNTWKVVDEQATETRLKSLMPAMSACYNSAEAALVRRRECTPNTREQVLEELSNWRHDRKLANIYWLNGMAGTGKTTITNTLCALLDKSHELGASFFCTRLLPECRNIKFILPTISYQLARFSHPFRCALSRVLERDPDVHTRALSHQLESLIIGPLQEVAHTLPTDLVVVIDALDECDDSDGVGHIIEMFARRSSELPVKVFLSSRPEPQIRDKIAGSKSQLVLHELEKSIVNKDIETYLRTELERMSLSESQLASLVKRAGVLFIYAATVVRYIGEDDFSLNPKKRLENVLGASAPHPTNKHLEIDQLYALILTSALDSPKLERSDKDRIKLVLHTVICAQEPLTINAIARLVQLDDPDQAYSALRRLWSVLHISGANNLVTTLHASFPDYVLDLRRSEGYGCDADAHHGRLAELCFKRIERNERQFNICGLESSYLFDEQILDLNERAKKAIPLDLMYACQYWAVHLELGGQSRKHMQLLGEFLSTRLLLWMEVLNLKRKMNFGILSLERTKKWCNQGDGSQELKSLVHDAWRFVKMFAANSVSRSTPHIYVSMLASWPSPGSLAECYIPRTRELIGLSGLGISRRQLALLSVFSLNSKVYSVGFSPDGTRIISGSDDMSVRVWDAQNGRIILGPLEGHTGSVRSVEFSPGGMHIASGSRDHTICLWDAQNGQMVLGPLQGHTGSVDSVAFSPDGTRIASGSADSTIRLWNVRDGKMALEPLEGNAGSIYSVAFSADGMRIVSGSADHTIHIWDAQSGNLVLGSLKGHNNLCRSVGFSPDGTQIVSGSDDCTVRVWNARNGQVVLGPLKGHAGPVVSVAFSPDGMLIVSGSYDNTVRVWGAQNGAPVLGPLEGHTRSVRSVAFSPDCMCIVSGSGDCTMRMWDAQIGQVVGSFEGLGHSDSLNSVSYSPDGARIVSSSSDKRICVWDAQTGQMALEPLEGHTERVYSAAFSPDGRYIVSGSADSTIHVWDVQNGRVMLGPLRGHTRPVHSVEFSPDGMHIVSSSGDSTIRVWDAHSGKLVLGPLSNGHTGPIDSVVFSPDGTCIACGCWDGSVYLWNAQNGALVLGPLKGHSRALTLVAFSPNGMSLASASRDETIRVWNVQDGRMLMGPLRGHTGPVYSVAFSPDGERIVSGSEDKTICIWDVKSGEMVLERLNGHIEAVVSVAFSPDGTRIISGSRDKAVRVWHVQGQQLTANPGSSSNPVSPCFAPTAFAQHHANTPSNDSPPVWVVDEHGWVVDDNRHLVLWVPPDLRGCLLMPQNTLLISAQGPVQLSFNNANIGELWTECYSPM